MALLKLKIKFGSLTKIADSLDISQLHFLSKFYYFNRNLIKKILYLLILHKYLSKQG